MFTYVTSTAENKMDNRTIMEQVYRVQRFIASDFMSRMVISPMD